MADLTDKEITEACTRAMGYVQVEHQPKRDRVFYLHPNGSAVLCSYNPIHDDAQAMALVKKLDLMIGGNSDQGFRNWLVFSDRHQVETWNADLNRAICLCAARVQIEKEKN